MFTADQTEPHMAVIDTATDTVKTWVKLDGLGYGSAPTPDGRWLLMAVPDENKVDVIDLKTMTLARNGGGGQESAGGAGAARRKGGVRFVHRQQPGGGDRSGNVEGVADDCDRQGDGWIGLGAVSRAKEQGNESEGLRD